MSAGMPRNVGKLKEATRQGNNERSVSLILNRLTLNLVIHF